MNRSPGQSLRPWIVIAESMFGAFWGFMLASSVYMIQAMDWFEKTSRDEWGPIVANRLGEFQSAANRNGLFWAIAAGAIMAILSWFFHYRLLPWRTQKLHENAKVNCERPNEHSPDKIPQSH